MISRELSNRNRLLTGADRKTSYPLPNRYGQGYEKNQILLQYAYTPVRKTGNSPACETVACIWFYCCRPGYCRHHFIISLPLHWFAQ